METIFLKPISSNQYRVYGSHPKDDKLKFWEELRSIRDGWSSHWSIAGELNGILHSRERTTSVSASNTKAEFRDFINYSALFNLELRGETSFGLVAMKLLLVLGWIAP